MKKTLLQINVTANWGSTGKIAEAIGNSAMDAGWDSYIAYGRMSNSSSSNMIKVGSKINTYVHYLYNRLFDKEGLSSNQPTRNLVEKIKFLSPDVVHLHNIHDHWLNYNILFDYLNQTDIKVVWTFHDCWAFTGHCYHFVQHNCMKWKTECGSCPQKNRLHDRSRKNYLLKKSLFGNNKNLSIVPCSNWMADFVKESFLKEKRIQVIHNGIDLNIFKELPGTKRVDDIFNVIAVSNVWLPYKGIYDIYELRKILPMNFKITVVGLSDNQMKNLPSGICGITRTQNVHELVQLYNEADVLINPTYADTFPTVNLEALACGTPVITYRTGGSPEAVDEKTGVVIPQGDVKALAEAIQLMKKHPLKSSDCRERAESLFDKNMCFKQYIELYNRILNSKSQ